MKSLLLILFINIILLSCNTQKKNYNLSKHKVEAIKALIKDNSDSIIVNPPYFPEPTSSSEEKNYVSINCLYATDRKMQLKNARPTFGIDRSDVSYGSCNVSIPNIHKTGENESPKLYKLELSNDPNKHISVLNIYNSKKDSFFNVVNQQVSKNDKNIFVFIHGYYTSFNEAAVRTAQIYYDYGLKGTPIFYSWPSQNNWYSYIEDENNVEWSVPHFKVFLNDLINNAKESKIYLIGHSMGNRLLINGLKALYQEKNTNLNQIKEVVLIAPDMDSGTFKESYAPYILNKNVPISLYASSKDIAISISNIVHGGQRLGDANKTPLIMNGIETIDASNSNTDIFGLGHSYISDNVSVIDDIYYLINNHLRANQRRLREKRIANGIYWEFKR